jgi:hemolysin activation/secretion protein/AraC-like DNA-binding protein
MSIEQHLTLHELAVPPSGEWAPRGDGWIILRLAEGAGYLLQRGGTVRELGPGDSAVMVQRGNSLLRASRLGPVKLQFFLINPQLLNGLFTLAEGRRLEAVFEGTPTHVSIFTSSEPVAQEFARVASQPHAEGLPIRCQLIQLWADAITHLLAAPTPPSPQATDLRERFQRLLEQMSEAELAGCSLHDLASQLHCSERHFGRLFRQEFGVPLRQRQIELRLLRAQQLLAHSDAKIVNVAYDSGYRHLGLFNTMFKKRFGVTPSEWRRNSRENLPSKPRNRSLQVLTRVGMMLVLLGINLFPAFSQTNAPPTAPPAAAPVRKFEVRHYAITGNTVLRTETLAKVLSSVTNSYGPEVTFDGVRAGLLAVQKAYRDRGYVTAAVTLPQQQLTNATIKVNVTEGRLATINVVGGRYYSSNNIMRALPSLRTNIILNSFVLQRELDAANASRDRQIYPILGPGPDTGTSALTLQVKDRMPLHLRFELDNDNTPGTPDLRANFNGQYDNLWDLDHQVGLQYSFSPEIMKYNTDDVVVPFDDPMIANYSAYYRIPLSRETSVQSEIEANPTRFGYNEATHQFNLPVITSVPTFTVYASRATTDTGIQYGPTTVLTNESLLTLEKQPVGENITLNEDIGSRFSLPLPDLGGVKFTFSGGIDYKVFQMASFNTNNNIFIETPTNQFGSITITQVKPQPLATLRSKVEYLPLNASADVIVPDKLGTSFFNFTANFNVLPVLSGDAAFSQAAYSPSAKADYFALKMSWNREQQIYKEWTLAMRAAGQWAPRSLISNEQFPLGGLTSVRGYHEGEVYGDSGWDVSIEPRTPSLNIATIGGEGRGTPCSIQFSTFFDYGQAYLSSAPATGPDHFHLMGAGAAAMLNVGEHLGAQVTLACPLRDSPLTEAGSWRINFSLSAQF